MSKYIMKNIYIIGEVKGSYRTQNLIKILLDNDHKIYYCSIVSLRYSGSMKFLHRIRRKIFKSLQSIITFPTKIFLLFIADIVILPAMNNNRQLEFNIARLFRKKIITDYYISEYDTKVNDRGLYEEGSNKAIKLKKFDENITVNSDIVLYLNSTEAKRYSELAGVDLSKINYQVVPLCIEEKRKVELPFFTGSSDFITICWWGTYIPLHGIEKIIEAARILKDKKIDFRLYLFGNSYEKSVKYTNMVEEMSLQELVFINNDYTFKNGKLEEFLVRNCDIVLGNFGDSDKAKNVLVNKLIDGVAMKAPVLTGESIAPREFFDGNNDILYSKNNPKSIAESIEYLSSLELDVIQRRVNNAYEVYSRNFSEDSFKKKIINIIDSV